VTRGDEGRELVRRAHGELATRAGDARSTATVDFGGEVLTWSSLPAESRRAAKHRPPVLAEQVGTDAGYEQRGPEAVQVLRGWRAHRDALFVVVAARQVAPGRDGAVPVGPWRHTSVRRYEVVGAPKRRLGRVPSGVLPGRSAAAGPGRLASTRHHSPQEASAAGTWPHLPAPVRESLSRAVPVPVDWLGELAQRRGGERAVLSQAITMLRRDDARAVVVVATRERLLTPGLRPEVEEAALAETDWLVEQLTFELRAQQLLDPVRQVGRMPWT
jgi:hypothetical protein